MSSSNNLIGERNFLNPNTKKRLLWILGGLMVALSVSSVISVRLVASQQKFIIRETEYSDKGISITTIDFDSQGRAWVGTYWEGLIVYDGENSETITSGLAGNNILFLAFDPQGRAWISTRRGLSIFDGEDWQIFHPGDLGLEYLDIRAISFDDKSQAWIGTREGISIYDGEVWKTYFSENSGLVNNDVRTIAFESQGKAWIGTGDGVSSFDGEIWQTYTTDNSGLADNVIRFITLDSQDKVWIGTNNGLTVFDGDVWQNYYSSNTDIVLDCVDKILFHPEDLAWVFSRQAKADGDCRPDSFSSGYIHMFDGEEWQTYDEIHWNSIDPIEIDPEGHLWIGAWSGIRISKLALSNASLEEPSRQLNPPSFLQPGIIIGLILGFGFLWIIVFSIGHRSGYSIFSCAIPLFSFPIFYYFGFDESAQFFVPCTNMIVLVVAVVLAFRGKKRGESKVLSNTAIILNLVVLALYIFQFYFWATWH